MASMSSVKNPNENKKRKGSKKNKIAWRKHSDVRDVDSFLEEKNLEERLGAPFAERLDDELFCIDTQPNPINKSAYPTKKRKPSDNKSLRCYQVLKSHSAVPDPISKRNRVRTKEERHPLVTKLKADRLKDGVLNKKEMIQVRNQAIAREKSKNKPKRTDVKSDLWEDEDDDDDGASENPFGADGKWLNKTTLMHTLKNTGSLKKTIPKSIYKKLSVVPAIEPPHPGMSYNPSYEDHQALLNQIIESEEKVMKAEQRLTRATSMMFSRSTSTKMHNTWIKEMAEGLPDKDVKDENESDDGEYMPINPPAKNAKKPLQKRRKIREAKAEEVLRKKVKLEKKKLTDLHRLSLLEKEMEVDKVKLEMLSKKREKVKELKTLEVRQLSSVKYVPADLDFNLVQDIKGNLRNVKVEGSVMHDRFKSLQKRNVILPTRGKFNAKKGKIKRFERTTHKMGWEPKGF